MIYMIPKVVMESTWIEFPDFGAGGERQEEDERSARAAA